MDQESEGLSSSPPLNPHIGMGPDDPDGPITTYRVYVKSDRIHPYECTFHEPGLRKYLESGQNPNRLHHLVMDLIRYERLDLLPEILAIPGFRANQVDVYAGQGFEYIITPLTLAIELNDRPLFDLLADRIVNEIRGTLDHMDAHSPILSKYDPDINSFEAVFYYALMELISPESEWDPENIQVPLSPLRNEWFEHIRSLILKYGADSDDPELLLDDVINYHPERITLLGTAIRSGDVQVTLWLLENEADPNQLSGSVTAHPAHPLQWALRCPLLIYHLYRAGSVLDLCQQDGTKISQTDQLLITARISCGFLINSRRPVRLPDELIVEIIQYIFWRDRMW